MCHSCCPGMMVLLSWCRCGVMLLIMPALPRLLRVDVVGLLRLLNRTYVAYIACLYIVLCVFICRV